MPESRVKVVNAKEPSSKPAPAKQRKKKVATSSKSRTVKSTKQRAKSTAGEYRPARKTSAANASVIRVPTPDEEAALKTFAQAHKDFMLGRFATASKMFRALIEEHAGDSEVKKRARIYLSVAETLLKKNATLPKIDVESLFKNAQVEIHRVDAQSFRGKFHRAVRGSKSKSIAGSSLTQARNPRSGHFVKIDKASGTILSHKKSRGAYKGVPIVDTRSKQK